MSMTSLEQVKALLSGKTAGRKSSGGGDTNWYRFPTGKEEVKIRFLPAWEGADFFVKVVKRHYGLPGTEKSTVCPTTYGIDCPVCSVIAQYENTGIDETLGSFAAATVGYANVLVKKDPTQKVHALTPHVATLSAGVVMWLVNSMDEPDFATVTDPYEGRDILFARERQNGKFNIRPAFSASAIADSEDEVNSILAGVRDLDKQFKTTTDDDINTLTKIAEELKDVIENKVLVQSPSNGGTEDHQDADEAPKMETTVKPTQRPVGVKPVATKTTVPSAKPAATVAKPVARTAPTQAAKPVATPQGAKPVAKPVAAPTMRTANKPVAAPVEQQAAVEGAPDGSPACFGDANTYNPESDECGRCEFEFHCDQAIKG